MAVITVLALIYLAKHLAKASPVPDLHAHDARNCVQLKLPVHITSHNAIYDLVQVNNNVDATNFDIEFGTHSETPSKVIRNITISDTFNIGAQLCIPTSGSKKDTIQIATHGLAFDKRYWDVTIDPSQYSYVDAALAAGYSILTYDRLGNGESDKPDAYKVVQSPAELEILRGLTEMTRNGELLKQASKAGIHTADAKFNKVIHVGHSYGSSITSAMTTTYGNMSDGAVITGYIINPYLGTVGPPQFDEKYAPDDDSELFGGLSSGYLVIGTPGATQYGFLSSRRNKTLGIGGFTKEAMDYGYSVRQPITAGEWASMQAVDLGLAPDFKGPILFMNGEFDMIICGGDCRNVANETMIEGLYPKATNVSFHLQPGTGHGLNLHREANVGYKYTLDWLSANGL